MGGELLDLSIRPAHLLLGARFAVTDEREQIGLLQRLGSLRQHQPLRRYATCGHIDALEVP